MKRYLLIAFALVAMVFAGFSLPRDVYACESVCHVVRPGENLYQIARYYGTTVAAIVQANHLWNPNLIYVGQRLVIPGTCPPPPPPGCTKIHIVRRGEYLKMIAARYHTSITAIVQLNHIRNPNLIYPGQRLKIPVKCGGPAPTPEPTPSPTGPWTAKYWNNRFLSGNPKFTRSEALVNHNWGTQGPGGGIGGTNFSVRWTRTRYLDAGTHRFNVEVDDGVRVWLDGALIIDEWHDTSPRQYSVDKSVNAGTHSLQIDYYQNQGSAQIRFWIDAPQAATPWSGSFFNNTNLQGDPVVTRSYSAVNFNWGNNAPEPGVTADYFSARFKGEFDFAAGKYHFSATADDGIRVYLDGNLILNEWHETSPTTYGVDVDVAAGKHKVRVDYFEAQGTAVCKVSWALK